MKRLTLLFLFLVMAQLVDAKHIIGGVMTYTYLPEGSTATTNRYKFSLYVYRDCYGGGADFDSPAEITIYEKVDNSYIQVFSGGKNISAQKSIPIPQNPCWTAPDVCVEEARYDFNLDLPITGNSYFISYQRCCRNETITNISTPGDVGATYSIELTNAAMLAKNSSPTFTEVPPIVICDQVPITYDHSAIDPDGDQLVYSFCSPIKGGGPILSGSAAFSCDGVQPIPGCSPPFDPVNFIQPTYSPTAPMAGNPTVAINSTSGLITGTPQGVGQYVVAVCAKEYRSGVLMSMVRREFQFNVSDCQLDILADVKKDTILGNKNFLINSCGQSEVPLINLSLGGDKIFSYYWEFNIPGSNPITSDIESPILVFPDTGYYEGKMVLNSGLMCSDSVDIGLNIFPAINANFGYSYDTCISGPVIFTDSSSGEGIITDWSWDFGNNVTEKVISPSYLYPEPGIYQVALRVEDGNHCVDTIIQEITWQPAPQEIIFAPSTHKGCIPARIFFDNLSTPIDSTYLFEWEFSDGITETDMSPTHTFTEEGWYSIFVRITSPIGCEAEANFPNWIQVLPSPIADFTYAPDKVTNFSPTIDFTDQSIDAVRWFWNFDSLATTQEQNPSYAFQDTGRHVVYLRVVHQSSCVDTISKVIDVIPEITFFMPNAFTPNEDTKNDIFNGVGILDGIKDYKMTIWNRWGEQVFETQDTGVGWNGSKNNLGRPSPPGVYLYVVEFTGPRGKEHLLRGFATLIR